MFKARHCLQFFNISLCTLHGKSMEVHFPVHLAHFPVHLAWERSLRLQFYSLLIALPIIIVGGRLYMLLKCSAYISKKASFIYEKCAFICTKESSGFRYLWVISCFKGAMELLHHIFFLRRGVKQE